MRRNIYIIAFLLLPLFFFIQSAAGEQFRSDTTTISTSTINFVPQWINSGTNLNDMLQTQFINKLDGAGIGNFHNPYHSPEEWATYYPPYSGGKLTIDQLQRLAGHCRIEPQSQFWDSDSKNTGEMIFLTSEPDLKKPGVKQIGHSSPVANIYARPDGAIAVAALEAKEKANANYVMVQTRTNRLTQGWTKGLGAGFNGGANFNPVSTALQIVASLAGSASKNKGEAEVGEMTEVLCRFYSISPEAWAEIINAEKSRPAKAEAKANDAPIQIAQEVAEAVASRDPDRYIFYFAYDDPELYDEIPNIPMARNQYTKTDQLAQEINSVKQELINRNWRFWIISNRSEEGTRQYNAVLGDDTHVTMYIEIGKRLKRLGWTYQEIQTLIGVSTSGEHLRFSPNLEENRLVFTMVGKEPFTARPVVGKVNKNGGNNG
jgi:hypothetical protein